jgi:hypothetical protein
MKGEQLSRRVFLGQMALACAAAALVRAPESLGGGGWLESAHAAGADVLHDTFNGLMAFVVPGREVLAGVLPAFVAFFVYSEAGTFDPVTKSLTGVPVLPTLFWRRPLGCARVAGVVHRRCGYGSSARAGAVATS